VPARSESEPWRERGVARLPEHHILWSVQ